MEYSKIYNWLFDHRHPIFLGGLITFFILPEVLEKVFLLNLPLQIFITILVVTSIMIIQTSPRKRILSYVLVLLLVIFIFFLNNYKKSTSLNYAIYISLFIYFSFITFYLFKDLLRSDKVTASVIIGAFAGYFMIGVMAFFIYTSLEMAYPDTLNIDLTSEGGIEDTFYFSFITLTAIGYGDFVPTSTLGQRIVILEGLAGQFYLAIVMAIIVGKFLSHKSEN